jgi:hypothetical protein
MPWVRKQFRVRPDLKVQLLRISSRKAFPRPQTNPQTPSSLATEKLEAYAAQYQAELEQPYDAEPESRYWPAFQRREEDLWVCC